MTKTLEPVYSIAEQLLGSAPDKCELLSFGTGGGESDCFRLWVGDEALFMKINHRPGEPLGIYFHKRLRDAGLPVPEVIAWHSSLGPRNSACAIWEYVDGDQANWSKTGGSCPYDEAQCGELLRRIHDLSYEGPFCFPGDDKPADRFGPCSERWSDIFPCAITATSYFDQGFLTRKEADILAFLPDRLGNELGQVTKKLLHMDFIFNGNLILESGGRRIIAITDGAESMAGDPLLELALFDQAFPTRNHFDMDRFRSSYGTTHDPDSPVSRFYILTIFLFERYFFSYVAGERGKGFLDEIKSILQSFD